MAPDSARVGNVLTQDLFSKLETSDNGISNSIAEKKLQKYGLNTFMKKIKKHTIILQKTSGKLETCIFMIQSMVT